MAEEKSVELWKRARQLMPGGVNSPVRAFGAVGGGPVFARTGSGSKIEDVDGRTYVDYVMSWGPLILGHACPGVLDAAKDACDRGTSFGMPTETENLIAERIVECVPSIDKVRMVNSGTEAVMSAIRLARGFTGRDAVVKFEGCYHGHVDSLLAAAGSGVATFAIPGTPGIPACFTEKTILVPYNDAGAVEEIFGQRGDEIACVILEPVGGNMGVVPPADGFLAFIREITRKHDALLVFDEVITGFRLGLDGAQGLYGVTPDLTVLGKIVGGGFPAACYGGRADIMAYLAPEGPVYQAGTLSGNPVAMAAGLATLKSLMEDPPYEELDAQAAKLGEGLGAAASAAGVPVARNRVGSMQTLFFTDGAVTDYASAKRCDTERYGKYFHGMLEEGMYFAPSQFEACFVSTAHSDEDIERTVEAAGRVMENLQ